MAVGARWVKKAPSGRSVAIAPLQPRVEKMRLTEEIGDIAEHPDKQKRHADAVGALGLVVGKHLRKLDTVSATTRGKGRTDETQNNREKRILP